MNRLGEHARTKQQQRRIRRRRRIYARGVTWRNTDTAGVCVWFKLNAPFNQFCWHALSPPPPIHRISPLNSFQYRQRNERIIIPSRHDPKPNLLLLSPSFYLSLFSIYSLLHPSVPNSIFAFAFALFIYLFIVMLVYCFAFDWLRRLLFDAGQRIWPAFCFFFSFFLFDFAFTFALRIRPVSFIAGIFDGKKN